MPIIRANRVESPLPHLKYGLPPSDQEAIQQFLERTPRFHFHFTPTSASWLNAVESWFSQIERRSLYRGVFPSVAELRRELRRYVQVHNEESAKPFVWTKSAKTILAAVKRAKDRQECSTN